MLTFLLFTVLFVFAGNFILRIFFEMIQPEGALDILFRWQAMLERLYGGTKRQQLLGKALGDCMRCTAFWFMPLWYLVYCISSHLLMDMWISDMLDGLGPKLFLNVVWYLVFHAIGAELGFYVLVKTRKDGL